MRTQDKSWLFRQCEEKFIRNRFESCREVRNVQAWNGPSKTVVDTNTIINKRIPCLVGSTCIVYQWMTGCYSKSSVSMLFQPWQDLLRSRCVAGDAGIFLVWFKILYVVLLCVHAFLHVTWAAHNQTIFLHVQAKKPGHLYLDALS